RSATDATGTVVWRWESDAFGSMQPTGSVTVNLRFPGQYYDQETGLHYNYFRYYDPATGRYLTSDPIGLRGGLNTYVYAESNPIKFTDPFGLFTDSVTAACRQDPFFCSLMAGGAAQGAQSMFNEDGSDSTDSSDDEPKQCSDEEKKRKNCQALKDSILATCAGLTGRKKFACFQAAQDSFDQCMEQD
ncbi:MAG TPA: RHS repeat-associated core domain-containing protein, partial [Gammaproteobacteria bacterium]|nr:RHS repeat-associated core domain-containing protein [Gammaproteobacteria bacterium]